MFAAFIDGLVLIPFLVGLVMATGATPTLSRPLLPDQGLAPVSWTFVVLAAAMQCAFFWMFWTRKGATPGKLLLGIRVVDATTGMLPSHGQALKRLAGYLVNNLLWSLGYLWVAVDSRKQGWHDKLAGTVVVHNN